MTQDLTNCADNVGIEPELFQPSRVHFTSSQTTSDMLNWNYKARVLLPDRHIIVMNKLKLLFITREQSLLHLASRASGHHIMTTSSRPVASI